MHARQQEIKVTPAPQWALEQWMPGLQLHSQQPLLPLHLLV
jgi:hypothetical protein